MNYCIVFYPFKRVKFCTTLHSLEEKFAVLTGDILNLINFVSTFGSTDK